MLACYNWESRIELFIDTYLVGKRLSSKLYFKALPWNMVRERLESRKQETDKEYEFEVRQLSPNLCFVVVSRWKL